MVASYLANALAFLRPVIDDNLVEIAINPDCDVWIERRGDEHMHRLDIEVREDQVMGLVEQIANESGSRVSEQKPVFSVSIQFDKWLLRAQVLIPPAVSKGAALSLRFFNPETRIFEPAWLYGAPRSSSEDRREKNHQLKAMADKADLMGALSFCVKEKRNLIVSGGTSSGKTMVARFLQKMISQNERIITIEDAPDLLPAQPNKVMMVSLEGDSYRSPDALLKSCLRMRPDRIILSEIRGPDAYTFLKAINTGHGGSITTLHADTAELAVSRLAQAALEAAPGMTFAEMKSYIGQSIDVIVHTANVDGKRGIIEFFLPGDAPYTEQ